MIVSELFKSYRHDRLICDQLGSHTYEVLESVSRHARERLDYGLHFILPIVPYPSLRMNEFLERQQRYNLYECITIHELPQGKVQDTQEVFNRAISFRCVLDILSEIVGVTNKMLREYLLNGCAPFGAVELFAGFIRDRDEAEKYAYYDTFDVIQFIAEDYAKSDGDEELFVQEVNLFTLGCIERFHKATRHALSVTPKLSDYEFFNSLAHCGVFASISPANADGCRTIRVLKHLDYLICGVVMVDVFNKGYISMFSVPTNDFLISKYIGDKGDWFKNAVYSSFCDMDSETDVVIVDPSVLVDSEVYTSYTKFLDHHSENKGRDVLRKLMYSALSGLFDPMGCHEPLDEVYCTPSEIRADITWKRVEAMAATIPGHVVVLVDGTENIASMMDVPARVRQKRPEDIYAIMLRSREVQAIKNTNDFTRLEVSIIRCAHGEITTNCSR